MCRQVNASVVAIAIGVGNIDARAVAIHFDNLVDMQLGALRAADGEFVIVPEVNFIHKITVATGEIDFRLILAIKVIDLDVAAAAKTDRR